MQVAVEAFGVAPAGAMRRTHPRYETRWWSELTVGSQIRECYVYNVSLGGAKLLVFGSLPNESHARLFIPPFGAFECELRWTEGQFVGVKFVSSDTARAGELVACALSMECAAALPPAIPIAGPYL